MGGGLMPWSYNERRLNSLQNRNAFLANVKSLVKPKFE